MAHTDWVITSQLSPCCFTLGQRGESSVTVEKLSAIYIYHKTHIRTWSSSHWPPITDCIGLWLTAVTGKELLDEEIQSTINHHTIFTYSVILLLFLKGYRI